MYQDNKDGTLTIIDVAEELQSSSDSDILPSKPVSTEKSISRIVPSLLLNGKSTANNADTLKPEAKAATLPVSARHGSASPIKIPVLSTGGATTVKNISVNVEANNGSFSTPVQKITGGPDLTVIPEVIDVADPSVPQKKRRGRPKGSINKKVDTDLPKLQNDESRLIQQSESVSSIPQEVVQPTASSELDVESQNPRTLSPVASEKSISRESVKPFQNSVYPLDGQQVSLVSMMEPWEIKPGRIRGNVAPDEDDAEIEESKFWSKSSIQAFAHI
jgi:hypothetical protein